MPTVKEVLRDKVGLDIECVDRVYLNGYVKYLQMPGGVINFIREQRNWPIPSPKMMQKISGAFREGVKQYAVEQAIPFITFKKQDKQEQVATEYLAQFQGQSGVVLIGKAQATRRGSWVWCKYSRQTV